MLLHMGDIFIMRFEFWFVYSYHLEVLLFIPLSFHHMCVTPASKVKHA